MEEPNSSIVGEENVGLVESPSNEIARQSSSGIGRSHSDAQKMKPNPKVVRFRSLEYIPTMAETDSNEDLRLLSAEAHQIGRATYCGGWQNTIFARRKDGIRPSNDEEEVQEIASAMDQDTKLMADDIDGEILRRDTLRELTKSMTLRRQLRKRLITSRPSTQESTQVVSLFKGLRYSFHMKMYKLKQGLQDVLKDYSLWHKHIKTIEGIYGTSVGCYFRFLRYLFVLNFFISLIIIGICLIPQMIYNKNKNEIVDLFDGNNKTAISGQATSEKEKGTTFGGLDWLTGAGWFTDTALYYGGYITGNFISPISDSPYNMSQAYFFSVCICFIIYMITLMSRVSYLYKINYIDVEEDYTVTFVQKVFSAWDFNITDEKAAAIKSRSIYNELIELVQEYQDEEIIEGFFRKLIRRIVQCVMWFIVVSFLILLGWGLYVLLRDELHKLAEDDISYWKACFDMLVYPFVVTLLMIIIPILLEAIVKHEGYSKERFELYATLVRVILLELVVLVVLVLFWFGHSPGLEDELHLSNETSRLLSRSNSDSNETISCWETALGQEIYRLVLVDFLVILVTILVFDSAKPALVRRGKASESLLTFNIARNTLHIIYNQTLLWAGLFFCPLLPLIISFKFWLIFYLQKMNVTRNLQPRERPWRAAQTETLFYALTLLSFLLAFFSFVFIVVRGYSSPSCGPFQGYTHYVDLLFDLAEGSYHVALETIAFLLRPGVLALIIGILCILVYCAKNVAEGQHEMVSVLRKQLELEVADRMFYIHLIDKVRKGKYIPGSPIRSGPSSPEVLDDGGEPKHLTKSASFVFSQYKAEDGMASPNNFGESGVTQVADTQM